MKLRPCSPSFARRDAGMTLMEFMVAIGLSALIALMIVSVALANRNIYQRDIVRTRVNQNVRAALELIGAEVRQAGERLPASFPAIQLTDGGSTTPDTLVLRRNLLDDALFGCGDLAAGAVTTSIPLSRNGAVQSACIYANQLGKMNSWASYITALGASPKVYVFNQTTRAGEFMQLTGSPTTNTGTVIRLNITGITPANSYVAEATWLYILNQWQLGVNSGVLRIVENNESATPQNVVDQITNFQVQLVMQDGSIVDSLAATGSWTSIQAVRVTITGEETNAQGQVLTRTLSSDFFPRNILST